MNPKEQQGAPPCRGHSRIFEKTRLEKILVNNSVMQAAQKYFQASSAGREISVCMSFYPQSFWKASENFLGFLDFLGRVVLETPVD